MIKDNSYNFSCFVQNDEFTIKFIRDFSINSIAFLFDKKCLIDPVNGINDIQKSFLRTYSKINLKEDPLRILRCFRFVSDLNFKIDISDEIWSVQ